ncbi:MAG TPA: hypothetical protein VF169_24205 [Albitalea sp.]|uniref:hypothetical protein n=1 Tax=Piscinibacter sp. TaxID=1903157 RepID=UPI002ED41687
MTHRTLPWLAALALVGTLQGALANEASNDSPAPDRAARMKRMKAAADVDHDGRLSREEAKKMPRVAQHFDEIDTGKTGYVTKEQVQARAMEMAAEHGGRK